VQENNVATNIIGNLAVRLFLGIYNCEINRAQVVSMLLQEAQIQNYTDMIFHILGHIGTSIASHNIMFDLCLVLQSMSIPQYGSLCLHVENFRNGRETATPLMVSSEWPRQCRMSLRRVLKTLQHEQKVVSPTHDYVPPDMPTHAAPWASKSSTEQQITLLITCMQSVYLPDKHAFITSLFGNIVTVDIDKYAVKHHRLQGIVTATTPLLQKISNNIDMTNARLITLINRFVEECFNGIFGNVHQMLMTLSFFAQMYVIAYLEAPMRLKFFQHTIEIFNRRLESNNKELTISCNIPHNLITNMDFWAKNNLFSTADFFHIFKAMCV